MIDYEVLIQTIAAWKSGARPVAPNPPIPSAAPTEVEEYDSAAMEYEEEEAVQEEGYEGQGYEAQEGYAQEGYE
ncbi:MAG: hypothetical protein KC431_23935, partial [Myxococcales bacterium]|nr:hypothetical protein [Myxococcales bacterium]